jgi:predicted acetyltransferase
VPAPDDLRIVPLRPEDIGEILRVDQSAFAFDPQEGDVVAKSGYFDWDRTWGAVRPAAGPRRHGVSTAWGAGEELAGQYTVFPLQLTVPGAGRATRTTPMAGLSWVAVHPDHRRRGVLSAMMRHHLHGLHEAGQEAISGLFASETVIYQRFGYGDATGALSLTLPRGAALRPLAAPADVRTQLSAIGPDDELADLVHAVFHRTADRPGRVSRPEGATRDLLRDRPWRHRDSEPYRVLVARRDGDATGYALLRRTPKWDDGRPNGTVNVAEVVGADAPTLHALWSRILDFDLMSQVQTQPLGLDDPLVEWLVDIRSASGRREDGLWLRLVDVDRALVARSYAAEVDIVLEVEDALCPWNRRRWRLATSTDGATCSATSDPADLSLPVQDLAAAYLGGRSLAALERAGLVVEHRPGAVSALAAAMRASVQPAVPPMF